MLGFQIRIRLDPDLFIGSGSFKELMEFAVRSFMLAFQSESEFGKYAGSEIPDFKSMEALLNRL
jgi:hypothetical protein